MTTEGPPPPPPPPSHRSKLAEIAALFARLGFTAFGGPPAHVAMMEEQVVARRRWLDRQHFLDLLGAVNFIPGPSSTELAIQLGYVRAGFAGLVVAGVCFIVPAVLIILPLGWLYVAYAYTSPRPEVVAALAAVKACVVAIVAAAVARFARTGIKDSFTAVVAALATIASAASGPHVSAWLARHHVPLGGFARLNSELAILAAAAITGAVWYGRRRLNVAAAAPALLLPAVAIAHEPSPYVRMALFFLKVGATLFGSGYVLVSYLQSGLVDQRHWLTQQQLLDAIAVGQVTPGPLLTTATFIGFLLGHQTFGGGLAGGVGGALLATASIFLPSFVFVSIIGPVLPRIRGHRLARGALDGANAAVVALILVVAVRLGFSTIRSPLAAGVAAASLLAILIWRVNSTWLIFLSAAAGVGGYYVGWRP
jgi:chromate transporter